MADKPNRRTSTTWPATIGAPVALVTCWAELPVAQQAMIAFNWLGKAGGTGIVIMASSLPISAARGDLRQRFSRYAAEWKEQSKYMSNSA